MYLCAILSNLIVNVVIYEKGWIEFLFVAENNIDNLVVNLSMDVQTEKIELAKRLLETEHEAVLIQIKEVFENYDRDFWHDLPQHVKAGIERGLKQAAEGKVTPHDEVMKKYAKYL
jgi:predicted transcriptional regulator